MRITSFEPDAYEQMIDWLENDRKLLKRILRIIKECKSSPFEGIGKPEPLKGNLKGYWSRRIDDEHRLIYKVTADEILVISMRGQNTEGGILR
jgi:toxin YoeB